MEQINPYVVMRNTATHEAYKAYVRKASMAGQPYFSLAMVLVVLAPVAAFTGGRILLHRSPMDWRFAAASYLVPVFLAVVFTLVGVIKTMRYRREHPIPDEWRQIPRSSRRLVPERKPRLPRQG